MLSTRKDEQANVQHSQNQIISKALIVNYIQLIQSYLEKEIKNPFIIFTLLCQTYKNPSRCSLFCFSTNFSDQWPQQWLKLASQFSDSLEKMACLTTEEDTTLRNFLSKIKFASLLKPTNKLANLLGAFFLYFPQYRSSTQGEQWEKMHKSILFTLQPTDSNKTFIINLFRRLFNQNIKDSETCLADPFYYLKHSAALLSDQDWIKISDRINTSRVNEYDFQSHSFAVKLLVELATHIPAYIQQGIIRKLLPCLFYDDNVADTVSFILKKYSYVISKEQRSHLFKIIYNSTADLTIMQINFLGSLVDAYNENEMSLMIKIFHNKILAGNRSERLQTIAALGDLFLSSPHSYFNLITQPIINGLNDKSTEVQIQSIRSLAKIALHSSYEQRKMIIHHLLCFYFLTEIDFVDSDLSNEKIEIALKFLLEDKNLSEIKNNFLLSLSQEKCFQFVKSLCMDFFCNTTSVIKCKNIIIKLGQFAHIIARNQLAITLISEKLLKNLSIDMMEDNDVRTALIKLSSIFSKKTNTILVKNLYKIMLSGKDLNDLDQSLKNWSSEQKCHLAVAFEFLAPLFSNNQLNYALIRTREMLIDYNKYVRKDALIALGNLLTYVVGKNLISDEEKANLTSQLYNKFCSSWLEHEVELAFKDELIYLERILPLLSSDQHRKIIDFLFGYMSSDSLIPGEEKDIDTIFAILLPHLTSLEKAHLYIKSIMLESAEIREQFASMTEHLYISLYELPKVMPLPEVNHIIESYLAPRYF